MTGRWQDKLEDLEGEHYRLSEELQQVVLAWSNLVVPFTAEESEEINRWLDTLDDVNLVYDQIVCLEPRKRKDPAERLRDTPSVPVDYRLPMDPTIQRVELARLMGHSSPLISGEESDRIRKETFLLQRSTRLREQLAEIRDEIELFGGTSFPTPPVIVDQVDKRYEHIDGQIFHTINLSYMSWYDLEGVFTGPDKLPLALPRRCVTGRGGIPCKKCMKHISVAEEKHERHVRSFREDSFMGLLPHADELERIGIAVASLVGILPLLMLISALGSITAKSSWSFSSIWEYSFGLWILLICFAVPTGLVFETAQMRARYLRWSWFQDLNLVGTMDVIFRRSVAIRRLRLQRPRWIRPIACFVISTSRARYALLMGYAICVLIAVDFVWGFYNAMTADASIWMGYPPYFLAALPVALGVWLILVIIIHLNRRMYLDPAVVAHPGTMTSFTDGIVGRNWEDAIRR